jgi:hypothetical protein
VGNEEKEAANTEGQGTQSERILEDAFLTGGVGMGTTPRLSASTLNVDADAGEANVFEDDSWRSHAVEEGESGDAPPKPKGLGARLRRWMGG